MAFILAGDEQSVIDDSANWQKSVTQAEVLVTLYVKGKGPLVIRECVRLINGDLTIESLPGRGSRLEITIGDHYLTEAATWVLTHLIR